MLLEGDRSHPAPPRSPSRTLPRLYQCTHVLAVRSVSFPVAPAGSRAPGGRGRRLSSNLHIYTGQDVMIYVQHGSAHVCKTRNIHNRFTLIVIRKRQYAKRRTEARSAGPESEVRSERHGRVPVPAPPPLDALPAPLLVLGLCDADARELVRLREVRHPAPRVARRVCRAHNVERHLRRQYRTQRRVQPRDEVRELRRAARKEHVLHG